LAGTLNDMLDRLAAGSARNRAFVADAAHELRSPLTSMRTQLEVGRAHPSHAEWDEISAGVLEDLQRLTRLVDDLLVLARLDDGHGPAKRARTTDLRAVAAAGVTRMALRNKVNLVQPDGPVLAQVDPDAVARVIDNLLSNADRHASSLITVEVRDGHGWAVLSVSDDGPGIPVAERDRVFQRFTRLDESRSQYSGGSGLGLAIVHQVLRSAGGSIVLEDAGPGLRAVVTLPTVVQSADGR
jgi:signal transduction histidine kinase